MIDEPGSFSGIASSANPARGPQDIRRMSLAILYSDTASVRSVPDSCTSASWAPCTANLFGAVTNGRPVSLAISAAASSAKPGAELISGAYCGAAERQSINTLQSHFDPLQV